MTRSYTVGIWKVRRGREEDFVAAWRAMGEATLTAFPSAHGTLLRDAGNPGRFISFGPWESREQIEAWRASAPFQEGLARLRDLLEDFEPATFELSAEVSAGGTS